ncbi:alpha/beta hydrolase family protein [Telluribacter sp.]|jgi:dipeptidyl aminopeptidase/acylaminoacyl peptidase|uniref:alpha/beta hydrolase family protein n=1 Tax=Telluribacter sp. TaxID=1978767 RepID=UPI002E12E840|nr:prolyl oligopeptidase family serine peptidase [Telluribacter sp.]
MKYFFSFLLVLISISAKSQNRKIIEQIPIALPDSTIHAVEKVVPGIKSIIAMVNFYRITYSSDGLNVKGYLAIPKKKGSYPCIIYNRGGNKEFGKITDAGFLLRGLGELSSQGYIIVASQYRGNDGGEGKEEFGGKDINDVLNLIPVLSEVPKADTSRIGMFGWSRGGMMTYLALTKTTKIKAAVVGSGITDLTNLLESRPEFDEVYKDLIPGYADNKVRPLNERSAVQFAEKINKTTPILILQGTADWRVPTNQVLDLANRFYQIKQPFRFILYEGGEHSLIEHRSDYLIQTVNWFNTYLRDRKTWPSLETHGG